MIVAATPTRTSNAGTARLRIQEQCAQGSLHIKKLPLIAGLVSVSDAAPVRPRDYRLSRGMAYVDVTPTLRDGAHLVDSRLRRPRYHSCTLCDRHRPSPPSSTPTPSSTAVVRALTSILLSPLDARACSFSSGHSLPPRHLRNITAMVHRQLLFTARRRLRRVPMCYCHLLAIYTPRTITLCHSYQCLRVLCTVLSGEHWEIGAPRWTRGRIRRTRHVIPG
ncbi:hypothetical protein B0H16DRAFT_585482 [Mycena metata]|uniref:Uncharacterized protein n=1 Tax=Mycena metata TaxID=1033252 RepID=A0AAD7NGZ0_9AGAR|nr:hypothetical protein B0H16DRAFT_585482 [Mycena metata]